MDQFYEESGHMCLEVRNANDADYLKKMIRYANMMRSETCLDIQFFYDFQPQGVEAERAQA